MTTAKNEPVCIRKLGKARFVSCEEHIYFLHPMEGIQTENRPGAVP